MHFHDRLAHALQDGFQMTDTVLLRSGRALKPGQQNVVFSGAQIFPFHWGASSAAVVFIILDESCPKSAGGLNPSGWIF
jgi:hypothetical protein